MSDFQTILVRDSTIGDITSDIDFAVKSGASQTTYQRFPSTSSSNSSVIFTIQVPSENVVIGRDMLINTSISLTINAGELSAVPTLYQVAIGDSVFAYGLTDSFQAFPFNALLTTATAQINNTTVSINMKDVLPSLLRMNNSRELYAFNSTTPSLPDQAYGSYSDAIGSTNSPLANYNSASYDIDQTPRGAFPVEVTIERYVNNVYTDHSPISTDPLTNTWKIFVRTQVAEPLFLSPFIYGNPEFNCQGLLGINNMSLTLNVDAGCKRVWSTANHYITNIELGIGTNNSLLPVNSNGFAGLPSPVGIQQNVSAPAMLLRFLSTQPSDLVQTKNVVPYMDFPRYLTSSANNTPILSLASATLTSSNLQINQIPDMFIISVRKPMANQDWFDSNSFLAIQGISINLNNQSGLLSSSSVQDLWRLSSKNGSTQSWLEFCGQANATPLAISLTAESALIIPTTGSLLVVNPAYDLSLPDYITCGSLGNYNFQFTVQVANQFPDTITPEICVICVNSGVFTTQQGVSAVYTGILTKEMVLDAKTSQQASAFKSMEVKRMTGGNLMNMANTAIGALARARGIVRPVMAAVKGMHGGAPSGGKSRLSGMC